MIIFPVDCIVTDRRKINIALGKRVKCPVVLSLFLIFLLMRTENNTPVRPIAAYWVPDAMLISARKISRNWQVCWDLKLTNWLSLVYSISFSLIYLVLNENMMGIIMPSSFQSLWKLTSEYDIYCNFFSWQYSLTSGNNMWFMFVA